MGGIAAGVLGAAGSIAGGIAGREAGAGDIGEGRNQQIIANQILQQIKDAPDIDKPLLLEKFRQEGILTPQMEQYISAQAPETITTDKTFKDAQMQALQLMSERAKGGLTAADRASLQQARQAAQGDVQSRIASIQQQAAMRGQAGGTSELAAQLAAAQGGANIEASQANQLAQMQQAAREQAAAQLGQFGSQAQQQQFGQQFQQQQAAQEMQRFNVGNQLAQQARNVGAQNQAQAANLANAQQISNLNIQQGNQELYNQLQRQMAEASYNRDNAKIKAGGAADLGSYLQKQGQQNAQAANNLYSGIGQSLGGIAGAFGSPKPGTSMANTGSGGDGLAGFGQTAGGISYVAYDGGQIPHDYRTGGQVPGQAKVPGDHPVNDTVHAKLSPGEIVIPRSLAESKMGKEILKLINAHNSVKNKMNGHD